MNLFVIVVVVGDGVVVSTSVVSVDVLDVVSVSDVSVKSGGDVAFVRLRKLGRFTFCGQKNKVSKLFFKL